MPLLEQVLEKYPDQVKIVFKHFPLRSHRYARKAAAAALAAHKQGKFWAFSDHLFKNARQLNDQKVQEIVGQLELNGEQFQKDWKDPGIGEKIDRDTEEGRRMNVRGTPTIFVNGRVLRQRSREGLETIIEKELKKGGEQDTAS